MVIGGGGLQLAGPHVGDLLGVLVEDIGLVEIQHSLVELHAGVGQGLDQVHRVGVARLVVAAGVGVGSVGRQAEQGHRLVRGQREHAVVVLHDHGALLALPDGDVPGGGLHLVDGGVVGDEPGRVRVGDGDVALGPQEVVQPGAVAVRDARAHDGQDQHGRHDGRQAPHGRCKSLCLHFISSSNSKNGSLTRDRRRHGLRCCVKL